MKHLRFGIIFALAVFMVFGLVACSSGPKEPYVPENPEIYLYGETHGQEEIMEQEFSEWREYYNNEGMRHLFMEVPYFSAEFLNLWMQSDSDEILDALYDDLEGTQAQVPALKELYKNIKRDCPETIFHGTDVGHQYTTGQRYLAYLDANGLHDSESYTLAKENIEQGDRYYEDNDDVYRESMMVENFIREYDALGGEKIMGIYGGMHVGVDALDLTGTVPCMANQLKEHYGDVIYSHDLG